MSSDFPSLKGRKLLAILRKDPPGYEVVRHKSGSHRTMRSPRYPGVTLRFAFHDGVTISGRTVRDVLVNQAQIPEDEARKLV